MYKILFTKVFIVLLLASCKGQNKLDERCSESFNNAGKIMNSYAITYDKSNLRNALSSLDTSMNCKSTKLKSIDLKITIYSLLEDYENGAKFINSLGEDDFDKPYKKNFYAGIFKAEQLNSKGDTASGKSIYIQLQTTIKGLLQDSNKLKTLSKTDLYNSLVFVLSKYLSSSEIIMELNKLQNQFPQDSTLIVGLKETLSFTK